MKSIKIIGWLRPVLLLVALATTGCQFVSDGPDATARDQRRLAQANFYLSQGLTDSALAEFGLALEENPKLVEAYMGVGNIQLHRQNYEFAARAYEQAVQLAPDSFDAHYRLALANQLMGKLSAAVRGYLRALLINPNSPQANYNLASAYLLMGRPEDAAPYAVRSTELDPENQRAWANLAAARSLLGQFDQAVQAYRQAAELGELHGPILLGLADAHIRLGNYDQAMAVLGVILRRQPTATAYERLAYAQFKLRRFDEAMANYQAALNLDPDEVGALNGLGASLMTRYIQTGRENREDRDQALAAWRHSLMLEPNQPRIIDLMSRYERL